MYSIGEATLALIFLATVWSGAVNTAYFMSIRPRRLGTLLLALLFAFVAAQAAVYGWLYTLAASQNTGEMGPDSLAAWPGLLFYLELLAASTSLITTVLIWRQEN